MGGIAALITPPLAAHDCEIPAFAGMVYLCTGNCGRILAIMRATIWRGRAFALGDSRFMQELSPERIAALSKNDSCN